MRKAVLFDMDGTLVPMDLEEFTRAYLKKLAGVICPLGYSPDQLTTAVWNGMKSMVMNDGTMTNCERCWQVLEQELGKEILEKQEDFIRFYQNEFYELKSVTQDNLLAAEAVREARKCADFVVLSTNPIFPLEAVKARLSWVGLQPEDFDLITTYENSSYCKPNKRYYDEILHKIHILPEECLMIGNDISEDITPARELGMDTFLVTDCIIGDIDMAEVKKGGFQAMIAYLKEGSIVDKEK